MGRAGLCLALERSGLVRGASFSLTLEGSGLVRGTGLAFERSSLVGRTRGRVTLLERGGFVRRTSLTLEGSSLVGRTTLPRSALSIPLKRCGLVWRAALKRGSLVRWASFPFLERRRLVRRAWIADS